MKLASIIEVRIEHMTGKAAKEIVTKQDIHGT